MPPKAVLQRAIDLMRAGSPQSDLTNRRKLVSLLMNLRVIERLEAELGAAGGMAAAPPGPAGANDFSGPEAQ